MVSIITVNYNGYRHTCELIESLRQNETYDYEIIVVDNASPDGDAAKLKATFQNYAEVTLLASARNVGFAGGNNLGYLHTRGEYIMYLNNDTVIQTPFIESLVQRMQSSAKIGAVSPKIKYYSNPHIIQYAGYTPMNRITMSNHLVGSGQVDDGLYDTAHRVPFIHGACVVTSRTVLETVGSMAELYFLFYEELDWSLALSEKGYELWYEPASTVYHKESMTIQRATPLRSYYLTRSRMIFTRRRSRSKLVAIAYQVIVSYPIHILKSIIHGRWAMVSALSRGIWSGLNSPIK